MILDIAVLLVTFLILGMILIVQITQYDDVVEGLVVLIGWSLFLFIFFASVLSILKAGG